MMSKNGDEVSKWIEDSEEPTIMAFVLVIITILVALLLLAYFLSIFDLVYGVENAKENLMGLWEKLVNTIGS